MASKCSSERKNCTSLTLNQNIEMIKLSEEGMPKAKVGWKLGLLCQTVKLRMRRKVLEGNEKCYFSEHVSGKKGKQPYCWCRESLSDLDRGSNQPQHSLKPKTNLQQFCEWWEMWRSCREKKGVWASRGWFIKFQERSCVHDLEVQGEATSADVEAQQIIQKIWLRSVMKAVTLNHRFSK